MRRILAAVLLFGLIFLSPNAEAASKIYGFIALSGAGTGALGAIDGTALNDKDMAVGVVGGVAYTYYLDSDSGASESSPQIISPSTNAGTKRWILSTDWSHSVVYNQATFDALASVAANTHYTVIPGAYAVNADMTIPAYASLTVHSGVTITVATTKTLTINGPFSAGDYKVFNCTDAAGKAPGDSGFDPTTAGKVVLSGKLSSPLKSAWWGDTGDGSTNDYGALCLAFESLPQYGKLIIGPGTHLFSAGLTWDESDTEVEMQGILLYTGTSAGTALTIGKTSNTISRLKGNVKLAHNAASDWSTAIVGVKVDGVQSSEIHFDRIGGVGTTSNGGFQTGIYLDCVNGGTYFNKFYLGTIRDNKRGVYMKRTSGANGINGNEFFGGNFICYEGTGDKAAGGSLWSGSCHISTCPDGATEYQNNGNTFYSPSFEGGGTTGAGTAKLLVETYYFDDGRGNALIAPRIEGDPIHRVFFGKNAVSPRYVPGLPQDTIFRPSYGYVDLAAYAFWSDSRGGRNGYTRTYTSITGAVPTAGTFTAGTLIINNTPVTEGIVGWSVTTSGTISSATDNAGDTDGSTAVITGMADTSDFYVGEYVVTSTGFTSSTDATEAPVRILAKTASTITIDATPAGGAKSNITVSTPSPTFVPIYSNGGTWTAFSADDTTPSVSGKKFFYTANANPTTITTFDGGVDGQEIIVKIADALTTLDFSSSGLLGNNGADYTCNNGDMIRAIHYDSKWHVLIIDSAS